jgi:hypothetical protein
MASKASQFVCRKFDGDDAYSWAVFRKGDLPKGHRGPVFYGQASPIVSGCSRAQANSYKKSLAKNS